MGAEQGPADAVATLTHGDCLANADRWSSIADYYAGRGEKQPTYPQVVLKQKEKEARAKQKSWNLKAHQQLLTGV